MVNTLVAIGVRLFVVLIVIGIVIHLFLNFGDLIKDLSREVFSELAGENNEHKTKAFGLMFCILALLVILVSSLTMQSIKIIIGIILQNDFDSNPTSQFYFAGFAILAFGLLISRHVETTSDPLIEKQQELLDM